MAQSLQKKYKVILHIYDISSGMAKQFSPMLLGKQIDGIWHTGLVVYGKEFYFGGGICKGPPSQTPYGRPVKEQILGETEITEDVFDNYLLEISHQFTIDKYDLFTNNCNNFTDNICNFLLGIGLPKEIVGLPQEIIATPFGQMIKPMIDQFTNSLNQQSSGSQMFPEIVEGMNNPQKINFQQAQKQQQQYVEEIKDIEQLFMIIEQFQLVIIDCYSDFCPPCKLLKPIYHQLAKTKMESLDKELQNKIKFCSIDQQKLQDAAELLEIQSIPTILFYYNGEKKKKIIGLNEQKLKVELESLINKLKQQEQQKESSNNYNKQQQQSESKEQKQQKLPIDFQFFVPANQKEFLFKSQNLELPLNKTITYLSSKNIDIQLIQKIQQNNNNFSKLEQHELQNLCELLISQLSILIKSNISEAYVNVIPLLDLAKELMINDCFLCYLINNYNDFIQAIFSLFIVEQNAQQLQKPLKLIGLRFLNNFFSNSVGLQYIFNNLDKYSTIINSSDLFIKNDIPTIYTLIMMCYNIILYQDHFKLNSQMENLENFKVIEIILDFLIKIIDNKGIKLDDSSKLGILLILLNFAYKNDEGIEMIKNKQVLEKIKEFHQSQEVKIVWSYNDLYKIVNKLI